MSRTKNGVTYLRAFNRELPRMRRTGFVLLAVSLLMIVGQAQADFINLSSVRGFPDILTENIQTDYDGSASFTASGDAIRITSSSDPTEPFDPITDGEFILTAAINNAGEISSASLTINGSSGSSTGLLVQAVLADSSDAASLGLPDVFGFESTSDDFEFLLRQTGGQVPLGDSNGLIGIILDSNVPLPIDFTDSNGFSGSVGTSDSFNAVPIPAALPLFSFALVGLAIIRRRRDSA